MKTQKTLGIIGGMSWKSTQVYYQLINQGIKDKLGGLHSANIVMHSLDFAPIANLQAKGDWEALAEILIVDSGLGLKNAGAKGLLIATNTMHKVAKKVEDEVKLPLIHIADATAKAIKDENLNTVALLGTKFTMGNAFDKDEHFYKSILTNARINVVVPNAEIQDKVHSIIYDELCQGKVLAKSRQVYKDMITDLARQGAQGVILGCTEIGLLIKPEDSPIPVFDTTAIHAGAAVEFMLGD